MMSTALTLLHLRFDCIVQTPLQLGGAYGGQRLRNALANVMLRAVCPETHRRSKPTPEHAAVCPVCWLLAAEANPGEVRRVYSLVPPYSLPERLQPGEKFSFILTLYGPGIDYFPYFLLAVPAMGETGVGPGRGKFVLDAVHAVNPFNSHIENVLAPGESVVSQPTMRIDWQQAVNTASAFSDDSQGRYLELAFITPARLIFDGHLLKMPDFGVFFRRLLARLDDLGRQYAGQERRSQNELASLNDAADRVRLLEHDTCWVDVFAYSGRSRSKNPMGGFVGRARYYSSDWKKLLPWLLMGQAVQVGKSAVKGNGVFEIIKENSSYWQWAFTGSHSLSDKREPGPSDRLVCD